MRLLLDEMLSPAIARELRAKGFDVQAVKHDRPDLEGLADAELVKRIGAERRAIATDNVADFELIHERLITRGEEHFGMLFSHDATLPRNKASIPLWVSTLETVLAAHGSEDALRNRIIHLP